MSTLKRRNEEDKEENDKENDEKNKEKKRQKMSISILNSNSNSPPLLVNYYITTTKMKEKTKTPIVIVDDENNNDNNNDNNNNENKNKNEKKFDYDANLAQEKFDNEVFQVFWKRLLSSFAHSMNSLFRLSQILAQKPAKSPNHYYDDCLKMFMHQMDCFLQTTNRLSMCVLGKNYPRTRFPVFSFSTNQHQQSNELLIHNICSALHYRSMYIIELNEQMQEMFEKNTTFKLSIMRYVDYFDEFLKDKLLVTNEQLSYLNLLQYKILYNNYQ